MFSDSLLKFCQRLLDAPSVKRVKLAVLGRVHHDGTGLDHSREALLKTCQCTVDLLNRMLFVLCGRARCVCVGLAMVHTLIMLE